MNTTRGKHHDVPQLVTYGSVKREAFTVNDCNSLTLRYDGIKRKLTRSNAHHAW
jgi:hypothetical protein